MLYTVAVTLQTYSKTTCRITEQWLRNKKVTVTKGGNDRLTTGSHYKIIYTWYCFHQQSLTHGICLNTHTHTHRERTVRIAPPTSKVNTASSRQTRAWFLPHLVFLFALTSSIYISHTHTHTKCIPWPLTLTLPITDQTPIITLNLTSTEAKPWPSQTPLDMRIGLNERWRWTKMCLHSHRKICIHTHTHT